MRIFRQGLLQGAFAASLVCCVSGCAIEPSATQPPALSSERIAEIIANRIAAPPIALTIFGASRIRCSRSSGSAPAWWRST